MDLFVPVLALVGFVIVPFLAIGIALIADLAMENMWHRCGPLLHRWTTHAALHRHS
jgi:hypothetical protein